MTLFASILAATTIAFPRAGQRLPFAAHCHLIGATDVGVTNLVVQGREVEVYHTGAWLAMVDVIEGTNVVAVGETNVWFVIGPQAAVDAATTNRVYSKLAYAADQVRPAPTNCAPAEVTVWIDAGHGGADTGARSPHGWCEKDVNLAVAKRVCAALRARGVRVRMTREQDVAVPLYDRPKAAHADRSAAAFVSIHHNASAADKNPREVRHSAVYAWNPPGERLAKAVNRRLAEALAPEKLADNGVLHANFAVTRSPEIPSCLVEIDFITTPEGEEACWNVARQERLAAAIADGILKGVGLEI